MKRTLFKVLARNARTPEVFPPSVQAFLGAQPATPSLLREALSREWRARDHEDLQEAFELLRATNDRLAVVQPSDGDRPPAGGREFELPAFLGGEGRLPGQTVELHLFEPRYRQLAKESWDSNRKFISLPKENSQEDLSDLIGVVVHLEECVFLSDERAYIKGYVQSRCRVKSQREVAVDGSPDSAPLALLTAEPLADEQSIESTRRLEAAMRSKLETLWRDHPDIRDDIQERWGLPPADSVKFSFWCLNWLGLSKSADMLRTKSTAARLEAALDRFQDLLALRARRKLNEDLEQKRLIWQATLASLQDRLKIQGSAKRQSRLKNCRLIDVLNLID